MSVFALQAGADPTTVEFAISGRIEPEDVSGLCDYVCARLQTETPSRVICDLGGVVSSDAVVVEALARLQLASRRRGCSIELRNASTQLRDLLELVGLDRVVPAPDA